MPATTTTARSRSRRCWIRRTEGAPATYLVYANRSRGDLLKGGFGGLKRSVARSQARKAAEETLGTMKRMLERASPSSLIASPESRVLNPQS